MFPSALDPRDQTFRTMLALSVAFHVVLFIVFFYWAGLSKPSPRFVSVTVVDLVGSLGPEPRPAQPEARRPAPETGRSRERAPEFPRPKAGRDRAAKTEAVPRGKAAPAPRGKAAPAPAPPDTHELSERIRKLRQEKASEEHVREALGTLRKEREARAAVGRMRERVARRVDLSALPSPPEKTPPRGGGPGGGAGSARVPPEQMEYFRALYEKIYDSWILLVPREGRSGAGNLIAVIRLKIEKDGKVTDVEMESGSGNRFFDDSVLRAIKKASPLPVPPVQLRGTEDHYQVGFRFGEPKGEW